MTTILHHGNQGYIQSLDGKRFVSWWDMLQVDARNFLSSLTLIGSALGEYQILLSMATQTARYRATQPLETRALVIKAIKDLGEECSKHGLSLGAKFAKTAQDECSTVLADDYWYHPFSLRTVTGSLEQLIKVVVTEAETRQFYLLDHTVHEQHDDADTLFGAGVVDAFPQATFDIAEAGKCLSFGLWTACVMHTMRIIESGLDALAQHVGVTKSENWNKTLNEIEAAIRNIRKGTAGANAEQEAAEAGTHLRFIKNAWRNHAMHQMSKYDEREAREIFSNARSFMTHMAQITAPNR